MADGCFHIVRILMFVFNFLFSLSGGTLLGVGIWIFVDGSSFQQILSVSNSAIFSGVWFLLFIGGFIFFVGVLGCCGALNDSKCLLTTFFFVVLGVLVVETTAGILALLYFPKIEEFMKESMIKGYGNLNGNRMTTDNWDTLQSVWECCGINGPEDWMQTYWINQRNANFTFVDFTAPNGNNNITLLPGNGSREHNPPAPIKTSPPTDIGPKWMPVEDAQFIPTSCCKRKSLIGAANNVLNLTNCMSWSPKSPGMHKEFLHTKGCKHKVAVYFWLLGIIIVCVFVVEMFGLVLSCCLYRGIGEIESSE